MRRPATQLVLLSLLAVPIGLPAPARAATFLAQSVEETARTSDAVVRGTVIGMSSRWVGTRIVTDVEIAVTSAWKGAPGRTVTVTVPGGAVGDLAQRVDAAPEFTVGEDVVVFVQRAPRGKMLRVNGLAMGKYRVENGQATPASQGARLEGPPVAVGEKLVQPMTVDELERRVRGVR